MDQKKQLIEQWQSGRYSKAELARRFGVAGDTVTIEKLTVGRSSRRRTG